MLFLWCLIHLVLWWVVTVVTTVLFIVLYYSHPGKEICPNKQKESCLSILIQKPSRQYIYVIQTDSELIQDILTSSRHQPHIQTLSRPRQKPSRPHYAIFQAFTLIPHTFQTPSRHWSGIVQKPSRQPPNTFQTSPFTWYWNCAI